jgi:PAS domain S-box-containing protein
MVDEDQPRRSASHRSQVLKAVYALRQSVWSWFAVGLLFIGTAIIATSTNSPLTTLAALVTAVSLGYVAPRKTTLFILAALAALSAVWVWAGPSENALANAPWLAASLGAIAIVTGVAHYIRELEERAWEFRWRAEVASEAADLGVFRWEFSTDNVQANAKTRELFELPAAGAVLGRDFFAKVHPDDLPAMKEAIGRAQRFGVDYRVEFRTLRRDETVCWREGRGRVIADPRSGIVSLAGVYFDITEAKHREKLVRNLIDGINAMVAIVKPSGEILEMNENGEYMARIERGAWRDMPFWDLELWGRSPDGREAVRDLTQAALTRDGAQGEAPYWNEHGEECWALLSISPILDASGEGAELCVCAIDITKRRVAEEKNMLLVRELNHRIKNLFSVTNALISLSARYATSVEDFAASTRSRLRALHDAHNIGSTDLDKRYADLRDIVTTTLKPWRTTPPRIFVEGESVLIDSGAATAWALIVHELATNASKHGALVKAGGSLSISWTKTGDGRLEFAWTERAALDGAKLPEGGFGSVIIDKLAEGYLSGSVERRFSEDGMEIRVAATL